MTICRWSGLLTILVFLLTACTGYPSPNKPPADKPQLERFTVAVIPDTQNYVDYKRQKIEGFALDSAALFIEQMQYLADNSIANGGDIVFAASVGDVWQHQTQRIDKDHIARGFSYLNNPYLDPGNEVTDKALSVEIPKVIEGFDLLEQAGLPFGVAPGNHDYDAVWSTTQFPPNLEKPPQDIRFVLEDVGAIHVGGLDNFRSVFGQDSAYFKDKSWYVDSFRGGANSAQIFAAGGYRFLHIALEMQPDNEVLEWAGGVLNRYVGLPTMITTHDYMNVRGERQGLWVIDLHSVDPEAHNNPQQMWDKLIRQHDQILFVFCGHQFGQALRVDNNNGGYKVYQLLADYQERAQTAIDAGQQMDPSYRKIKGTGDGWIRLLNFELGGDRPRVVVKTYSTHYRTLSRDLDSYANWYRASEQPMMTDKAFNDADDFVIELDDFYQRYGRRDE